MSWLEQKYIGFIGFNLRNFKRKNTDVWQFSCPFCGDSSKNEFKARGYIFPYKNDYKFHCQNCGITRTLVNFLKEQNFNLYNDYLLEKLENSGKKEEASDFQNKITPIRFEHNRHPLFKYKKVNQLAKSHPAKAYIDSRRISENNQSEIFWVPEFKKFINEIIPNKFDPKKIKLGFDEGRLIFPFFNKNKEIFGLQGRSLNPNDAVRYITIMFDETQPRIWGMDKVDKDQIVLMLEGPIDAMGMRNSVASCGGDIFRELNQLDLPKDRTFIVYDNEPRHPDTNKKMSSAISRGYHVCFWPNTVTQKDVNQMVTEHFKGRNPSSQEITAYGEEIRDLLIKSAAFGIDAEIKMAEWSKTNRKNMINEK